MKNEPTHPTHGPTGSPVEKWTIEHINESQMHRLPPPSPPSPIAYTLDDDGHIIDERQRSEEEYQDLMRRYELAEERYRKTGGLHFEAGPITTECRVTCEDGTEARGIWSGSEWIWMEYGPKKKAPANPVRG